MMTDQASSAPQNEDGSHRVGPWLMFGLVTGLFAGAVVLGVQARYATTQPGFGSGGWIAQTMFLVVFYAFPAVGILIARGRPENRIARICLMIGAAWGIAALSDTYALKGLKADPGSLPMPELAVVISDFIWAPAIVLTGVFLVLLFPDGRPPTPRWRLVTSVAGAATTIFCLVSLFGRGDYSGSGYPNVENPLAVDLVTRSQGVAMVAISLIPFCMIAAAVGLVIRYRRSSGIERLQLKWLVAAGAAVALTFGIMMLLTAGRDGSELPQVLAFLQNASLGIFVLIPIAIGFAVLRHRLYDVDVVINKTLVYVALTGLLAVIYLVMVTAVSTFAGDSELVTAASTLVVATAFNPLRRRVQEQVDHLFYRRRYDARRTLDAFTTKLRSEIDLDSVNDELIDTVRRTMHPEHVSVWLNTGADA